MAWYHGTYSCGHEGRVDVAGPEKDRQWKIDRHFEGLCPECYAKKVAEERKVALEAAKKEASEMELPELMGTPKQVAWAETIRVDMIKSVSDMTNKTKNEITLAFIAYVIEKLSANLQAHWFIDNRELKGKNVCNIYADEFRAYLKNKEQSQQEAQAEEEVKEEIAVKPENGNGVEVTISNESDCLVARCEKNETAREIFKANKMRWVDSAWRRKLNVTSGSYQDRAADLGNQLLLKGFTLVCQDKTVRENAVSGKFENECMYWITASTDSNDLLYVTMKERNDSIYNAARNIESAKWDPARKEIKILVTHYQDVLDFADDVGMKISPGAQKLIDAEIERQKNIKTVNPAKKQAEQDKLSSILKSGDDILDDLKD